MKQTNVRQFFHKFPTDEACLEHLFNVRFGQGHVCPKCEREAKWYRLTNEQAFSCQWCGHHIHPMVGSIFEKSRTPLQLWFYAIFLFTTSKHGVSAKELQRQLGVTYKTAWRMAFLIRQHMAEIDGDRPLGSDGEVVEIDETYVGGEDKGRGPKGDKTVVVGMVERGGEAIVKVIPDMRGETVKDVVAKHIAPGAEVHADMHPSYDQLRRQGYDLKRINKAALKAYVGPQGQSVNAVENFWRHLKASIKGTHNNVSAKHMERYAKEFEYRFNRRMRPDQMLDELLSRFPELGA